MMSYLRLLNNWGVFKTTIYGIDVDLII